MDVMRHTSPPGSGQLRTGQFSLLYGDRVTHGTGVSHTRLDPWLLHLVRSVLTISDTTGFLLHDGGGIVPD